MESTQISSRDSEDAICSTSSSNQLFISENLDLPDDTFRMSLDYISEIGENVTIGDRDLSIDNVTNDMIKEPMTPCNTPVEAEISMTPTKTKSPPTVFETPKRADDSKAAAKPQNLLKLSLTKNMDDGFIKPSPVAEAMSPAKMLQFEVDITYSATPTMKRAAIDFNFFNENNFEEYFVDMPQVKSGTDGGDGKVFRETPVIVKTDTVRHEIGYALPLQQFKNTVKKRLIQKAYYALEDYLEDKNVWI